MERRFKQLMPLQDRLLAFIHAMRERADLLPPGPERDELLKGQKRRDRSGSVSKFRGPTATK
jgi:hypothetical protein